MVPLLLERVLDRISRDLNTGTFVINHPAIPHVVPVLCKHHRGIEKNIFKGRSGTRASDGNSLTARPAPTQVVRRAGVWELWRSFDMA